MQLFNKNYIKPKWGDMRQIKRFAWIPKRISDKIVWLEAYTVLYVYEKNIVSFNGMEYFQWIKIGETCQKQTKTK